jgi:hypothetical protein
VHLVGFTIKLYKYILDTYLELLKNYEYINLQEPCVLCIGRAYRYTPDVAFYIYFFNKYK